MDQIQRKADIRGAMQRTREATLRLLEQVPDAFLKERVHDFYSPIGWHFGHIGLTEEYWVCEQALGGRCIDSALRFLFANIPENPKENRVHLPSRCELETYLAETRCLTLAALDQADLGSSDPLVADGYAWEFARQHECQHQETITELLQLIHQRILLSRHRNAEDVSSEFAPASVASGPGNEVRAGANGDMVTLPAGLFLMGSDDRHGYDNEKRAHSVHIEPFALDRKPVAADDWLRFMEDGGYRRRELWTAEGWTWRGAYDVERPEYWIRDSGTGGFRYCGPRGMREIDGEEPVSSLSWFEADAYARWAGKRLPTEEEWEYAAAFDPATGGSRRYPWGEEAPSADRACFGLEGWQPVACGSRPMGANAAGLLDMAGGVWEWTASPFLPYAGFEAFPYDGYSKEHMDGTHFVCRGGSWATSAEILRCSFRNWYVPTYRQGFLGLRCAR